MKRLFRLSLLHVLLIVGLFAMVLSVFSNLNQRWSVGHANHIALAVSRNGKQVAAGISTMPVRIWDSSSNELMASLEGHTRSVQGVAFTENNRELISVSYDNSIRLWDLETQHELTRIDAGQGPVGSLNLSSDEALLATGGGDGSIKLWDRVTGSEIAHLSGPTARVTRLAFSPDNAWLASIDFDGSVRVWDVERQRVAWSHPKARVAHVFGDIAFSADGILAIACHHTGKLELREIPSGNLIGELKGPEELNYSSVAFSPDGKTVALGHVGMISLHDWGTKQRIKMFPAHASWVSALAFCNDGKTLVSGDTQNSVMTWDVKSGKRIAVLQRDNQAFPWDVFCLGLIGMVSCLLAWRFASRPSFRRSRAVPN